MVWTINGVEIERNGIDHIVASLKIVVSLQADRLGSNTSWKRHQAIADGSFKGLIFAI